MNAYHDAQDSERRCFEGALELPPGAQREAWLAVACQGDKALEQRVLALLRAHEEESAFLPDASPTIATAPAERPGEHIGPYKLREQIGEGGFGAVWVADQEHPVRRRVALKIIKLGMDTREVIARFEQERHALAMMDHPNISRVLDAGATETGRPYFVMELVRGVKITEYCDAQSLSTSERIELFIQVCQAVQHAHQKGIIHRDLKPSNILVTVNDGVAVPKVIDFGVAKATQGRLVENTIYTQFQQMVGTPLYMSPEQAEMTSVDIDTRSDIYALGVLLYELLTGRTPIDTATMAQAGLDEIRRLIREVDPPRPSARVKTLPGNDLTATARRRHTDAAKLPAALRGDLDWIVMKCLEKDRKRRYDTANGLALDLQRHLKNEVVIARPPTTAYLLNKLIRRNRVAFAAGTAIAASLVIGIAVSVWQAVRADREAKRAVSALNELRETAPAFAEQARALAAKEQFDSAIEKLDYALTLRPDEPEYLVAKGDLLQCQFKLAKAAENYRAALRVQPGLARAEESAKLCDELLAAPPAAQGKLTRESLAKLHLAMQRQQRPAAELMPVARLLGEEKKLLVEYWLMRLKDLSISGDNPLDKRLSLREDGLLKLDLGGTKVTDLTPLAGMPIGELYLGGAPITDIAPLRELPKLIQLHLDATKVTDLSPLRGLPLEELSVTYTAVSDLSPLRGMRLKSLDLYNSRVVDLSPLAGMPLAAIDLSGAPVMDFSPLAAWPLERCYLQKSRITDLSVLQGKPLRELVLWGCVDARNYAVLAKLRSLEMLLLPTEYRDLPQDDLAAIASLRDHPRLRQIGAEVMPKMGYRTTGSKEVFWQDWDREQSFVPELRKSGFKFTLAKLNSGAYKLEIEHQPLRDLSFLKGAPIVALDLGSCLVADLTPLQGLSLERLDLNLNPVADLSPLRGMPLRELYLGGAQISNLAALAGMPLETVCLDGCASLTDVAVLAQIPTLQRATVPFGAANVEKLRAHPKLQRLAYQSGRSNNARVPDTSTVEFWKEFDEQGWRRAISANSYICEAAVRLPGGAWALEFNDPKISDLAFLRGGEINQLALRRTTVTDLSPLRDLPLTYLNLYGSPITDLSPLSGIALTTLDLRSTPVADLSPLRSQPLCQALKHLHVYKTNVTDFSPVAACVNLETFDASTTALDSLEVVRGRKLRVLQIMNTQVMDISLIAGMPLERVQLDHTSITDISPLLKCPTLKEIVLPAGARDVASLRALTALVSISYESRDGGAPRLKAREFWAAFDQKSQE